VVRGGFVDRDHIDDLTHCQGFQCPDQMWEIYPIHRGAIADGFIEEVDLFLRVLIRKPSHEVQFRPDGPL
jgi:hypothetical protein